MSEKLKVLNKAKIDALKAGDRTRKDIIVLILNEANNIAKNDPKDLNREVRDDDVVVALNRTIKKARETKDILEKKGVAATVSDNEIAVAQSFLPAQMSKEELQAFITQTAGPDGVTNKTRGAIMKSLKEKHDGEYDARMVNEIISEMMKS